MAKLPFIMEASEFHPLQPEDSAVEEARRMDPRYANLYRNRSAELTPDSDVPVRTASDTEYDQWVATCKAMDAEVAAAKREWHAAVVKKDTVTAELRFECEQARARYRQLELRPKPPQPQSERKRK